MADKAIISYDWLLSRNGLSRGQRDDPVGNGLIVHPVGYPEERVRFTTDVVSYDETTGIYETLNTVYVPAGPEDEIPNP
jgi:hypothetical protein